MPPAVNSSVAKSTRRTEFTTPAVPVGRERDSSADELEAITNYFSAVQSDRSDNRELLLRVARVLG